MIELKNNEHAKGRAKTPAGTDLALWSSNTHFVSCYPVAKRSAGLYFGPRKGQTFCLCLDCDTAEEAKQLILDLESGVKSIYDVTDKYHNRLQDEYALGFENVAEIFYKDMYGNERVRYERI